MQKQRPFTELSFKVLFDSPVEAQKLITFLYDNGFHITEATSERVWRNVPDREGP